jgi:polysaccharide biosynthesis protein PslH
MKVLFVTYDFPYPTNSGGKTRAYNLIKHKGKDVEIYLFSFVRPDFEKKNLAGVKVLGIKDIKIIRRQGKKSLGSIASLMHPTHSIFYGLYYNEVVAKLLKDYVREKGIDIIHFESYYTAFYLSEFVDARGVKQIFGSENIEAYVYEDFIKSRVPSVLKPLYRYQNSKIKKEEDAMFRVADINLAVTSSEKKYIENVSPKPVQVIPNGVDLSIFRYASKESQREKILLFVGNFTYHPNVDAAEYFYRSVFHKLPDTYAFHVIGKNAGRLSFAGDKSVVVHDFVVDILSAYAHADVFVSPIRTGGGTNFKILESMAVGLPIVAFPQRIEEMGAKNGVHLLTAENASAFAEAIEKITGDSSLREKVTKNARKLVEEKYSWESIGKEMNKVWRGLV